jgi:hypothetical protein
MKLARILLLSTLVLPAVPAAAAEEQAPGFGHMLTLMQVFVRLAGSDDPASGVKAMDDVLAGRNLEANQAAFGLFNEMTAGMPAEHRAKVASIAGDVLSLARRDLGKQPATLASAPALSTETSLQARKDLNAMGLRYFDAKDYLDAVKRGDELASRDADGRSATEIARAGGNPRLAELLARNLPAAR